MVPLQLCSTPVTKAFGTWSGIVNIGCMLPVKPLSQLHWLSRLLIGKAVFQNREQGGSKPEFYQHSEKGALAQQTFFAG